MPITEADLSLIPIKELLDEVERRTSTFVCAMRFDEPDEAGREIVTKVGHGKWSDAVGLATILQDDCLRNWPSDDGEDDE